MAQVLPFFKDIFDASVTRSFVPVDSKSSQLLHKMYLFAVKEKLVLNIISSKILQINLMYHLKVKIRRH